MMYTPANYLPGAIAMLIESEQGFAAGERQRCVRLSLIRDCFPHRASILGSVPANSEVPPEPVPTPVEFGYAAGRATESSAVCK